MTVLLTGATGYVGGMLLPRLLDDGEEVRCLVRDPSRASVDQRAEASRGDVVSGEGLDRALDGIETAYYLIHSMGRGSGPDSEFAERDRRAAENFGRAAAGAGVRRVVYLGGLGGEGPDTSEHLRSRHEVATVLRSHVSELVYVRAAMVIGAGSASFTMLRSLVERLPAMICPRWIETRTQPVAVRDVVGTLAATRTRPPGGAEVQVGGADVLTYREMMGRVARVLGRRPPLMIPVPVLTPRLSSYWVGFVTPVEAGLARPLIHGLSAETVVRTPPPDGLNADPLGFDDAVRAALEG